MRYSEGVVKKIENSGLLCKKKADISEIWEKFVPGVSGPVVKLICVEDDLKDQSDKLKIHPATTTAVMSDRASKLLHNIEKESIILHDAGKDILKKGRQKLEGDIVAAAIREIGADAWHITQDEYDTFSHSPNRAGVPNMIQAQNPFNIFCAYEAILSQ
jgi:hypothetical protein